MADDLLSVGAPGAAGTMESYQRQKLTRLARETSSLASAGTNDPDAQVLQNEKITKAATQFEAMLLQQMMKSMWKTVESSGLLTGSREEELYRDMFNETLANHIAEKQSIGVKGVVEKELRKNVAK